MNIQNNLKSIQFGHMFFFLLSVQSVFLWKTDESPVTSNESMSSANSCWKGFFDLPQLLRDQLNNQKKKRRHYVIFFLSLFHRYVNTVEYEMDREYVRVLRHLRISDLSKKKKWYAHLMKVLLDSSGIPEYLIRVRYTDTR